LRRVDAEKSLDPAERIDHPADFESVSRLLRSARPAIRSASFRARGLPRRSFLSGHKTPDRGSFAEVANSGCRRPLRKNVQGVRMTSGVRVVRLLSGEPDGVYGDSVVTVHVFSVGARLAKAFVYESASCFQLACVHYSSRGSATLPTASDEEDDAVWRRHATQDRRAS